MVSKKVQPSELFQRGSHLLVAFNSVSAAWSKMSSFALTSALRREGGKTLRKPGITHKFLAGDSSVSPLGHHRKEYWVFSSLCVCVLRSRVGVSFDHVKMTLKEG